MSNGLSMDLRERAMAQLSTGEARGIGLERGAFEHGEMVAAIAPDGQRGAGGGLSPYCGRGRSL